ncbi:hypothetical protein TWF132_002715 [Orbilia oligospora]|nr:hypothetical protein TWF132_002715 [Orbilia oligospora]
MLTDKLLWDVSPACKHIYFHPTLERFVSNMVLLTCRSDSNGKISLSRGILWIFHPPFTRHGLGRRRTRSEAIGKRAGRPKACKSPDEHAYIVHQLCLLS